MRDLIQRVQYQVLRFEESRAFPAMVILLGLIILLTMFTAE